MPILGFIIVVLLFGALQHFRDKRNASKGNKENSLIAYISVFAIGIIGVIASALSLLSLLGLLFIPVFAGSVIAIILGATGIYRHNKSKTH